MACDREGTNEACNNVCSSPTPFNGHAYVFSRTGICIPPNPPLTVPFITFPFIDPLAPTHVGFGFEVVPGVYVFGSVEDTSASLIVPTGGDNRYWMATGTLAQMLATFRYPPASQFHGALLAEPYDQYRNTSVQNPSICAAVLFAEKLYNVGYKFLTNNCLDAIYNVLRVYGVIFPPGIDPANILCPSGFFGWFSALPSPPWTTPMSIPAQGGSPVVAVSCPTTVPSSCTSIPVPP
jgi:hypothetical protein